MEKTRKPIAGGILAIITGVFGGGFGLVYLLDTTGASSNFGGFALLCGIIAITGGVFALRRKVFGLAATGSYGAFLCGMLAGIAVIMDESYYYSTLSADAFVPLVLFGVLGILAIVFTHLGKGEF